MFDFKTNPITQSGFYIFYYCNPWGISDKIVFKRFYYVSGVTNHCKSFNTYSYCVVSPNNRDIKTCHDFGKYEWVNSYSSSGSIHPTYWESMNDEQIISFKNKLYQFNRPKWQDNNDICNNIEDLS